MDPADTEYRHLVVVVVLTAGRSSPRTPDSIITLAKIAQLLPINHLQLNVFRIRRDSGQALSLIDCRQWKQRKR